VIVNSGEGVVHNNSGLSSFAVATAPTSSWPKWEETIVKGLAEGGPSLVALAFAAFTFLYGTLVVIQGEETRIKLLKKKLRTALYGTAIAVLSATLLSGAAFLSTGFESRTLGFVTIALALLIAAIICVITVVLGLDVLKEGN
jgi:hypothetical protein